MEERSGAHNTLVDGRMRSGEAKIANLVGEHLQTKEKKNGRRMVEVRSRKGREKGKEEHIYSFNLDMSCTKDVKKNS
jgi:hypothetical protein